jgi:ABC-type taurine transport system substrate-binding protein
LLSAQSVSIKDLKNPKIKALVNTRSFTKNQAQIPQVAPIGEQNHFPLKLNFLMIKY